jgi:site-specific DNA-methyltransferase (adenine-specific)
MVCAVVPEGTPIETLKAIVLKDNSSFGSWDVDLLKQDWGEFEFMDLGISVPDLPTKGTRKAVEDGFDVERSLQRALKSTRTKLGDLIQLGRHRLICGDSTDASVVGRLMDGSEANLLLTDPPYNVNYGQKGEDYADKNYGCGMDDRKILNDNQSDASFRQFLLDAFTVGSSHAQEGAAAYVWMGSSEIDSCIDAFEKAGWLYKQMLVWVKNAFTLGRQDYQWQHENCVYG